jgi:pilus assembly protein CpaB
MNSRAFTLSLIIAGVAMFMVWSYLDGKEAQFVERYGEKKAVLVAKENIRELDLLDDRKVQTITVPSKFVQPGALSDVKEIYNTYASTPILKGEQITRPRITHPGGRTGLSSQVAVGKRALSIRVNDETAVAKLIRPRG